jgi:hypothetical protein
MASTYALGAVAARFSHAHRIVGGSGESKDPTAFAHAAMAHLAHQRDGLQSAEAFLDPLPLSAVRAYPAGVFTVPRLTVNRLGSVAVSMLFQCIRFALVHRNHRVTSCSHKSCKCSWILSRAYS